MGKISGGGAGATCAPSDRRCRRPGGAALRLVGGRARPRGLSRPRAAPRAPHPEGRGADRRAGDPLRHQHRDLAGGAGRGGRHGDRRVDHRIALGDAWRSASGTTRAIQGNLDPLLLCAPPEVAAKRARAVLAEAGRPARVHLPTWGTASCPRTPVDHVFKANGRRGAHGNTPLAARGGRVGVDLGSPAGERVGARGRSPSRRIDVACRVRCGAVDGDLPPRSVPAPFLSICRGMSSPGASTGARSCPAGRQGRAWARSAAAHLDGWNAGTIPSGRCGIRGAAGTPITFRTRGKPPGSPRRAFVRRRKVAQGRG